MVEHDTPSRGLVSGGQLRLHPAQDFVGVQGRRKNGIEDLNDRAVTNHKREPLEQHIAVYCEGWQRPSVRLQLPFELLSDDQLELTHAWALPTFTVDGDVLLKRLTLVIRDRAVVKFFYPVFPPTLNADEVLCWVKSELPA